MALRFTIRQLEYFVAVGEAGSIAMAAEKVNVSSPSISTALIQLEGEFGLPLFVRKHAHGLTLTQAGRQFMVQAKKVLSEADDLNRLANSLSGTVQGPLAVGCLLTIAQFMVPFLRREFETQYSGVRIIQSELHQSEIFNQLRRAEIDIALTYDMEIPADLEFVPLARLSPYALMAEDHPLAELTAVSAVELAQYPMVLLDLPISSEYFMSFFNCVDIKPMIAERTKDMAVMRSLVANGFGYAIANIRPISDLAPDGRRLKFVPLAGAIKPMQLGFLMAEGASSVLTVRAFVEHCQKLATSNRVPGL